jgi:phosphoserine / homoserine phosphotransferase
LQIEEFTVQIVCLDLEGVLVPEIWIGVAERTGIAELRATTRDIPDYDVLMKQRLRILDQHNLGMREIQEVIAGIKPMEGAPEFLEWLRSHYQLIILSDTFSEFAKPLMRQLGWPTIFCHNLTVNADQKIAGYNIRLKDHKRQTTLALKNLNFKVVAAGDSYNDTNMLGAADRGFLFHPPQNVIDEFPQFPVCWSYDELRARIEESFASL